MIQLGPEICQDPVAATDREWLETNGLGGFASCTIAGIHTRRYHGLLTAATEPPVGRMVMLSKFEETLTHPEGTADLSANQYPGTLHPRGFELLESFRLQPYPTWVYATGKARIEKSVFMVHGENTTVISYRLLSPEPCTLVLRPLIAFRDFHTLTHENRSLRSEALLADGLVTLEPYDSVPPLHLAHNAQSVTPTATWYFNFEYRLEHERGLDYLEDLFNPVQLKFELKAEQEAIVIASLAMHSAGERNSLRDGELRRRASVAAASPVDDPLINSLVQASDAFVVKRETLKTVIAGYHWFADWGRDT
ncbi:MAG: glycogen debranching enzyme family protein, partial [Bryobacteraceae bacterium]|nr:glycogen debranching enzyme family protein [Bryobacteraceae bacterium]